MSNVDNIKVLYVLDKSGFGGLQSIVNSLLSHKSPGIEITYFFLRNINRSYGMSDLVRDDVVYSKSTHKYNLRCFFEFYNLVKSGDFKIVHLNGTKSTLFGYLIKRLFPQIKIISHDHSGEFDYRGWFVRFLKFINNDVDRFLCVSGRRKRFLVDACAIEHSKIQILNNFVDERRFKPGESEGPSSCQPDDCAAGHLTIGYVGRLSWVKGCDVLIKALPFIKKHAKSLKVTIAGDGPERETLQRMARNLKVEALVNFLGYIDEPASVYAQSDIIIIPSRAEEGPISLYEAWMIGVPVVASDAPVIDERIRDGATGLLFPSEDSEALAKKVLQLMNDSGLKRALVENGYEAVKELTAEKYVARLRDIYLSLS